MTHLVCWPFDIDMWMELNNGRTLTMMDLGRVVMFQRMGMSEVMRRKGWAGAVAGASIRYRKRVKMFDRLELAFAHRRVGCAVQLCRTGVLEGRRVHVARAVPDGGDLAQGAGPGGRVPRGDGPARRKPAAARLGSGLDRRRGHTTVAARALKANSFASLRAARHRSAIGGRDRWPYRRASASGAGTSSTGRASPTTRCS